MRFLRQSMIGLFLATVSLGLLVYAAQLLGGAIQERMNSEAAPATPQERVYAVNLVTAVSGRETPVLQSYGEVAARRMLEVRAAVGGRIVGLAPQFEDGGAVTGGMVMVQIDPSDMQAAFDRATADLADAQAEVRDADRGLDLARQEEVAAQEQVRLREQSFARQTDLAQRGVGTAATVEEAELSAAAARANVLARRQAVAAGEARVDQAATRLARSEIALAEAKRGLLRHYRIGPADRPLDDEAYQHGELAFDGVGLRPYAPAHLRAAPASGGDIRYSWIRRTRIGGDRWDTPEVPLGEESEKYLVRVRQGQTILREDMPVTPEWTYTASDQAADGISGAFSVEVAQISASFGAGRFAVLQQ